MWNMRLLIQLAVTMVTMVSSQSQFEWFYGRECSASGDCGGDTSCDVDVTLYRETSVTERHYCRDSVDPLRAVMARENLCKARNLNTLQEVYGFSCQYHLGANFVCDKQVFYFTVNQVWYVGYQCVPDGAPCATTPHGAGYCNVTYHDPCSSGEVCLRHKQYGYSRQQGVGLMNYGCERVCKVIHPGPEGRGLGRTTDRTPCPEGTVCSRQIPDIHSGPDCKRLLAYQCEPWKSYMQELANGGYFNSLFGTNEQPCMVKEFPDMWKVHQIKQCPKDSACVRKQVPSTAVYPAYIPKHDIDDKTSYIAYYCDSQALDQMINKARNTVRTGGHSPEICRVTLLNFPGQRTIYDRPCPVSYQRCTEISNTYIPINLQHSVTSFWGTHTVQSSNYLYLAWACM